LVFCNSQLVCAPSAKKTIFGHMLAHGKSSATGVTLKLYVLSITSPRPSLDLHIPQKCFG
jgi:hypothetical protein